MIWKEINVEIINNTSYTYDADVGDILFSHEVAVCETAS